MTAPRTESQAERQGRASGGGASGSAAHCAPSFQRSPQPQRKRARPQDEERALARTCRGTGDRQKNVAGTPRRSKVSLGEIGGHDWITTEVALVTEEMRGRVEVRCTSNAGAKRTTKAVLVPLDQLDGLIRLLAAAKAEAKARRLLGDA